MRELTRRVKEGRMRSVKLGGLVCNKSAPSIKCFSQNNLEINKRNKVAEDKND